MTIGGAQRSADLPTWVIESVAPNELELAPFPLARVSAAGTVLWGNQAWSAMARRSSSPDRIDGACGMATADGGRIMSVLARVVRNQEPTSIELDVPNLGLERWARIYFTPTAGSALVNLMPLRRLPESGDGPDPDEIVAAYEYLSEGVVLLDDAMSIRIATGFTANFLGAAGVAFEGRPAIEIIHPDDRALAVESFAGILSRPGEQLIRDLRLIDASGTHRWVEVIATNLIEHPRVQGILVMLRDVAARKGAEQRAARFEQILDASPDIIVLFDRKGGPMYANPAALRAAGVPIDDPAGSPAPTRQLPELIQRIARQLPTSTGTTERPWQGEVTLTDHAGEIRIYSVVVVVGRDDALDFTACLGRDITDRKRLEAELAYQALHDQLTGLPNRAALLDRLGRALRDQPSSDGYLGVMFLDLDNLKDVNDSVGHDVGDELLVEVARRLRSATRPSDVVCRLGGDEFVAICPNLATPDAADDLAERLRRSVTWQLTVNDTEVALSASVGLTVVPPGHPVEESPTDDALRLLRDADAAMYDAKQRGRGQVSRFTENMHGRADRPPPFICHPPTATPS